MPLTPSRAARAAAVLCMCAAHAAFSFGEDPQEVFQSLERKLLSARTIRVDAQITASGVVDAQFQGRASFAPRNVATLAFSGALAGAPHDVKLEANAHSSLLYDGPRLREERTRAEANYAALVAFARMGLVNNVARLASLQTADHADGGAERWVTTENFHHGTFAQSGPLEGMYAFGFDFLVNGQIAGTVRLWVDPQTGLPRHREQTVQLPQGSYRVTEDYSNFVLE